jgi:hypothetical protein
MSWAKRTRFEKAVLILGVLVVACVLIGYTIHLQSTNALEDYRKQLRAAGEKLDVNELIPPRVPPEQNGAELLRQAAKLANLSETFFSSNPPPAMRIVAPGKAMIGWKQADIRDSEGTNSWEEADALCKQFGVALDLLRQATMQPSLDFGLDYRHGFSQMQFPQLVEMRRSAQLLSAASMCDLHRGESAAAVTNVHTLLVLVGRWQNEPLAISQLVRIAMAQLTLGPNWELLQSTNVTESQLAALQADWADLEFVQPAENALLMERAMGEVTIANIRGSNSPLESLTYYEGSSASAGSSSSWLEGLSDYSKSVWRGTKLKTKEVLWRVSWSYADELRSLQGEQVLVDAARSVRTNGYFKTALAEQERKLDELGLTESGSAGALNIPEFFGEDPADLDVRWILSRSVLSLRRYIVRVMSVEAAKQLAVTAIALKRHQLRHGSLPSELVALVPELLPAVPRDPVDGKPLRYHPKPDGTFLLYSIGEDAVDDGGDAKSAKDPKSRAWQRGRDWVWPQPATADEIRNYENDRSAGN